MKSNLRTYFIPIYFDDINRLNAASARYRCIWPSLALNDSKVWSTADNLEDISLQFDIVIFQKLHSDKAIELAKFYKAAGLLVVLDLADPHSHYDLNQIRKMVNTVDLITVSSSALKRNYREIFPFKPIYIVEDGEYMNFYNEKKQNYELVSDKPIITWYGIADTLPNLNYGLQVLSSLKSYARFKVISDAKPDEADFDIEFKVWELHSYSREIINSDLVINSRSPKKDNRYKSLNKTITAWVLGLPCLFQFDNREKTLKYANKLLTSDLSRQYNAQNGNELAQAYYSTERVADQLSLIWKRHLNRISFFKFQLSWFKIRLRKYIAWTKWYIKDLINYYN